MKRIRPLLLTAALILSLAGCGGDSSSVPPANSQPESAFAGSSAQPSPSVLTGEISHDYFTANGLTVLEKIPEEFTFNALVFNMVDPQNQHPQPATGVPACNVTPDEEEGYKKVSLKLMITIPGNSATENMMISNAVYDLYTGRKLPSQSLNGTDGYDYSAAIQVNGVSYNLHYSKENDWEWTTTEEGEEAQVCYQTWTMKVPEDYDGLVYAAVDVVSDPLESLYETEGEKTEEIDESEYYAMDIAEDETRNLDNTVFFRFGNAEEN